MSKSDLNKQEHSQLKLNILDKFECMGGSCPLSCCEDVHSDNLKVSPKKWTIDIDALTLSNWHSLPQSDFKKSLLSSIETINGKNNLPKNNSRCRFYNDSRLCDIQAEMGHENLSKTCREYPRSSVTDDIQKLNLSTAHLSCPKVVMLLQDSDVPLFDDYQIKQYHEDKRLDKIINYLNSYSKSLLSSDLRVGQILVGFGRAVSVINSQLKQGRQPVATLKSLCGKSTSDHVSKLKKYLKSQENQQVDNKYLDAVNSLMRTYSGEEIDAATINEKITLSDELLNLIKKYLVVKSMNHGFPARPFNNNFTVTLLDIAVPLTIIFSRTIQAGMTTDALIESIYVTEKQNAHNYDNLNLIKEYPVLQNIENYYGGFVTIFG